MSDRAEQARAEAERQSAARGEAMWQAEGLYLGDVWQRGFEEGFPDGAAWADANPQPHTITRVALRDTAMMLAHTRQDDIEAMLPGLLGIRVEGDER